MSKPYLTVRELWLMSMAWNESPLGDDMTVWLNSPAEDGLTVRQALAKAAPFSDRCKDCGALHPSYELNALGYCETCTELDLIEE